MKRVLLFGSYAPSLINFRGPLIRAMVSAGHEVIAIAPAIDAETATALGQIGAVPLSFDLSNASLDPFAMLRSLRGLRDLLRVQRPDLIISYTIKPVILGALAGKAAGVPKIASLITGLGFAFTGEGGSLRRRIARHAASLLYRLALARSDIAIFQNPDDLALFRQLGLLPSGTPSAVVDGSGVDIEHFAPAAPPSGVSFLMIARLLRDKGIREFAEAVRRLRSDYPDASIALAGYLDSSPDSLTEAELGEVLDTGIHFHGRLSDVRPAIAACSVYVLPSYREGTPRSVLEAMAMERAIITTDVPGCRETVIEGVNGLLVPARDPVALYRAMKRFIEEPGLARAMGIESRKVAESRYDARKVSADIMRHAGL